MPLRDRNNEGFIHGDRLVMCVQYRTTGEQSLIVWFDRDGNDVNRNTVHSDPKRRIVTAKPGDVILWKGRPFTVASLAPHREHSLKCADATHSGQG